MRVIHHVAQGRSSWGWSLAWAGPDLDLTLRLQAMGGAVAHPTSLQALDDALSASNQRPGTGDRPEPHLSVDTLTHTTVL